MDATLRVVRDNLLGVLWILVDKTAGYSGPIIPKRRFPYLSGDSDPTRQFLSYATVPTKGDVLGCSSFEGLSGASGRSLWHP
jgi:hypothetical protein